MDDEDLRLLITRLETVLQTLYGAQFMSGNQTARVIEQVEEALEDIVEDLRLAVNPDVQRGIARLVEEATGMIQTASGGELTVS